MLVNSMKTYKYLTITASVAVGDNVTTQPVTPWGSC